jgi:membrane protein implicated in regulation of membrane protease activity
MDLSAPTLWWLLAGVLVAAELATGTFYLLMLALGAAAAALAAHAGLGGTAQVALSAVVGGGATAAWHFKRAKRPRSAPAPSNRDVLLDVGETVQVAAWEQGRQTQVHYRGARWSARFEGPGEPAPGEHVIVAVHGSELRLAPGAPAPAPTPAAP